MAKGKLSRLLALLAAVLAILLVISGCSDSSGGGAPPVDSGDEGSNTEDDDVDGELDLTSFYKEYFIGGESQVTAQFDLWGSGTTSETTEDGYASLTSAKLWGGNDGVCAAYMNLPAGYFDRFTYLVFTADYSNMTLDTPKVEGDNTGVNVKIPDTQLKVNKYAKTNADGTTTYIVPLSDFKVATPAATQFALIIGGEGTVIIKEVYVASKAAPMPDVAVLNSKIAEAKKLIEDNGDNIGDAHGNFPQSAVDVLNAAISEAQKVAEKVGATQKEYDAAVVALNSAVTAFNDSKIILLPTSFAPDPSVPTAKYWYASKYASAVPDGITTIKVTEWNPAWGQAGSLEDVQVIVDGETRTIKMLKNLNYQGITFETTDCSSCTEIRVSYYTLDGTKLSLYPIGTTAAEPKEYLIELDEVITGQWVEAEFKLNEDSDSIHSVMDQLKFEGVGNFYIDNIYIY